jgi:hypothetical protein
LKKGLATAKANGKGKVTEKHLDSKDNSKLVKKHAMDLYVELQAVANDPAFKSLSTVNRARVNALLCKLGGIQND